MRKYLTLFVLLFHIISVPATFAIPLENISYQQTTTVDSRVYGLKKAIEIFPNDETIDGGITLTTELKTIAFPHQEDYAEHFGFFQDEEGKKTFVPSSLNKEKTVVSAKIQKTGTYLFAPIVPLPQTLHLTLSKASPKVGETFTISSDVLMSNAGKPIWDGFAFEVRAVHVKVQHAESVSGDELSSTFLVRTRQGKLSFSAQRDSGEEESIFVATRDFSDDSAHGQITIGALQEKKVSSDTISRPNEPMLRGDFVPLVLKVFEIPVETIGDSGYLFSDVATSKWFAPALFTAKKRGLIQGRMSEKFRPSEPVTGLEALTILKLATGKPLDTLKSLVSSRPLSRAKAMALIQKAK